MGKQTGLSTKTADQKKLVNYLEHLINIADEAAMREYRVNLKHL